MLGIHTVYTSPTFKDSKIHDMLQFEVLTMILSCLNWRKYYGPIKLYCDDDFYEYIDGLGIKHIWDEIDTDTLKNLPEDVDYDSFWAYAKIYVNSLQTEPFANLDIDLYVDGYHKPSDDLDILFCNMEVCDDGKNYPPYHQIEGYSDRLLFKDFKKYAANVALLVVNNLDFYREYVNVVNHFVIGNHMGRLKDSMGSSLITFIEQRLLYAMIVEYGMTYNYQIDGTYIPHTGGFEDGYVSNGVTHLWGWKDKYRHDSLKDDRYQLTYELIEELEELFTEEWEGLKHVLSKVEM